MSNNLFVYGMLAPGRPNEHILKKIAGSWEKASVTGYLHNKGWGSAMGFPEITLDNNGNKVDGFIFNADEISEHWSELDEFEGDAYKRVLTSVEIKNNTFVDAYIYTLK